MTTRAAAHWFSPVAALYGGVSMFIVLAGGPHWVGLLLLALAVLVLMVERRV